MRALTVRQPWATLIVSGVKPIENRTWTTKHRGRIAIHAGQRVEKAELRNLYGDYTPPRNVLYTSAIVGTAVIDQIHPEGELCGSACRETIGNSTRTWAQFADARETGKPVYHWKLTRPLMFLTPIPWHDGRLGLWEITSPELLGRIDLAIAELS